MIVGIQLELEASKVLPGAFVHGGQIHAAFLRIVREADPALARSMHEEKTRSFTISPLLRGLDLVGDSTVISERARYTWRLNSLRSELSRALLAVFTRDGRVKSINIGKSVLTVCDFHLVGGSILSYEEILDKSEKRKDQNSHAFSYEFISPTAFKKHGRNVTLPVPELLFGGLARLWNEHSEKKIGIDIRDLAEQNVFISKHNLRTCPYRLEAHSEIGFVGKCVFKVKLQSPPELKHWLKALSIYARWAGAGKKCTMGMGVVKTDCK